MHIEKSTYENVLKYARLKTEKEKRKTNMGENFQIIKKLINFIDKLQRENKLLRKHLELARRHIRENREPGIFNC